MKKFYITTSIFYTNAKPHIGHALEAIQTDVLARWHKLKGDEVFFLTGTDEHGSKIAQLAKEQNTIPQAIAETNSAAFAELKKILNLSNNDFIRTSDQDRHWPGVQKLWNKLVEAGAIYKGTYNGFYCVGCEAFITEKDLVDGNCPIHKKPPELIKEENYFFKLSAYADQIKAKIKNKELEILPQGRAKEIINMIKTGLHDISFSRPKEKLSWGIPVPNDPEHTIYVWCDALSNYLTGVGFGNNEKKFNKWWSDNPNNQITHIIGKDILKFHAAIWPGMLLAANLPLPKQIFVHGFISSDGHKMSKSLGNVIDPVEIVERYGTDALRYYLLKEIPSSDDGDFSWKRFMEVYNSELADNLGNLISRVISMAGKYINSKTPKPTAQSFYNLNIFDLVFNTMVDQFKLDLAIKEIGIFIKSLNRYVDEKKPWVLHKESKTEELNDVLYNLLESLRLLSVLLYPFLPQTANQIRQQLNLANINENNFDLEKEKQWGGLPEDHSISQPSILFPKFDDKK